MLPYLRDSRAGSLERDCSCLVRFSAAFLYIIWTGLELELKLEDIRGIARILLKGVLNLVSLTKPFLQLVGCIVLTSLATLSAFSLET